MNTEQVGPEEIIEAIRNLPAPYRIIFNLSVIDEFNLKDISAKLEIPSDIVENNLTKAKEDLQNLLMHKGSYKKEVATLNN